MDPKDGMIKIEDILIDEEFNCRGVIPQITVASLMASIREHGLLQPVLVTDIPPEIDARGKGSLLVAGYRRTIAASMIGMTEVPAVYKAQLSLADAKALNLQENIERKNLDILQEATAVVRLKELGLSRDEIAIKLNQSGGWVNVRIVLMKLPVEVQEAAGSKQITQTEIRNLYELKCQGATDGDLFQSVRTLLTAKDKGHKISVKPLNKNPSKKCKRTVPETHAMQDFLRRTLGNGLHTRLLAWVTGLIADDDIYDDIENFIRINNGHRMRMLEIIEKRQSFDDEDFLHFIDDEINMLGMPEELKWTRPETAVSYKDPDDVLTRR